MNQPFYNRLCQLFVIVMVMVTGLYAQPVVTIPGSTINNGGNSTIPYQELEDAGLYPKPILTEEVLRELPGLGELYLQPLRLHHLGTVVDTRYPV
ncbi:MAG: hypothetical protein IPI30_19940 [Saprospiraceae bacterium]|nr:hypothetical protein [Candidatus Vicinibacter affinis]